MSIRLRIRATRRVMALVLTAPSRYAVIDRAPAKKGPELSRETVYLGPV